MFSRVKTFFGNFGSPKRTGPRHRRGLLRHERQRQLLLETLENRRVLAFLPSPLAPLEMPLGETQQFSINAHVASAQFDAVQPIDLTSDFLVPVTRARPFELNSLLQDPENVNVQDTIDFELFSEHSYPATVQTKSTDVNGTTTLVAKLQDYDFAYGFIALSSDTYLVSISIPELGERFVTRQFPQTESTYLVQLDSQNLDVLENGPPITLVEESHEFLSPVVPDDHPVVPLVGGADSVFAGMAGSDPDAPVNAPVSDAANDPLVGDLTDTPAEIDVMIVYTPAAANWAATNEGNINNTIAVAMDKANLVSSNSDLGISYNLVYSGEVEYTESDSSQTDIERLRGKTDGYMDEVHDLRNDYAADLVALLTLTDDVGGLGYLLNDRYGREDLGFSLTRVQQASWTYTLIHEIGHNMGAHHHKDQNVQPGPTEWSNWSENQWSAGWRWQGNDNNYYCSVMTYESGDYFPDGITHTQVPYFSNPNISHQGKPTGDAVDGDNARTLREVKHYVAAYRDPASLTVSQIVRADANPTYAPTVGFVVTFSEDVTGVAVDDFTLDTDVDGASVTGVSGSGSVYTVTVNTGTSDGTINLELAAGATIEDLAGNPLIDLEPTGADETYTMATTLVSLSEGTLTVTDVRDASDDNLVVSLVDSGTRLQVQDSARPIAGVGSGVIQTDHHTVTVPLDSLTALTINGHDGDDVLTVDLGGGHIGLPIEFHGGDGDDELVLTGGSAHTSTYTYVNASDGSVTLDPGGDGPLEPWTVTYTGLAPVTSDIGSDVVELIYTGGDETITISDAGGGQTTAVSTLGELTTFTNPTQLLRIVATHGTDTIDVGELATGYASIEIEADDASDVVNLNGALNFADNHTLTVSKVGTVNLPNAASDIAVSGTGTVSISALRNIELATGSSITTVDGNLSLSANQQTPAASRDFVGIHIDGGTVQATGSGTVAVTGRGGDDAGGAQHGVHVTGGGQILGGASGDGAVVTGTGGSSSGTGNHGVYLTADAFISSSGGDIEVTGIPGTGTNRSGISLAGNGRLVATTGTPTVTLIADSMSLGAAPSVDAGGNHVILRPETAGTDISLGTGGDGLELTVGELSRITAGTLTLGHADTGDISFHESVTHTADVNLVAGDGSITFDSHSLNVGSKDVSLSAAGGISVSDASGTDVTAGALTVAAGSAGVGSATWPLRMNVDSLTAVTSGNGPLFLREADTLTIADGGLDAGSGTIRLAGGTFTLGGSDRIGSTSSVNVTGGATLAMQAFDNAVAGVTLTNGSITGTGTLTSGSTFDLRNGSVSVRLAGSHGLDKTTAATVTLSGDNTYTGVTAVQAGTLRLGHANALGATGGGNGTVVTAEATLDLYGQTVGNELLTLNGTDRLGTPALINTSGTAASLSGNVTLDSHSVIGAGDITLGGTLGGDNPLTKAGAGELTLSGSGSNVTELYVIQHGVLNVTGGLSTSSHTIVGYETPGTLNWSGAGTLGGGNGWIGAGDENNAVGTINVTGGSLNISSGPAGDGGFYLGHHGMGALNVSGGTVTINNAGQPVFIGGALGFTDESTVGSLTVSGSGTVNVAGPGVIWMGANTAHASGTVTLDSGGVLRTARSFAHHAGTGTVNFDGGTLRATGDNSTWLEGLTAANVLDGGAVIDTRWHTVTVRQPLLDAGSGGLTKQGSGTLVLAGANTYSGSTNVSAGTLRLLAAPASPVDGSSIWLDATDVSGDGSGNPAGGTKIGTATNPWVNKGVLAVGNATQGNVNFQPQLEAGAINGRDVIRFVRPAANSAQYLQLSNPAINPLVNNSRTIFAVGRANDGAGDSGTNHAQALVIVPGYHSGLTLDGHPSAFLARSHQWVTGPLEELMSLYPYSQGDTAVLASVVTGGASGPSSNQLFTFGNPSLDDTSMKALRQYTHGQIRIGAGNPPGQQHVWGLTGDVGEVLIYDSALSAANRRAVEAYLKYKWLGQGALVDILPTGTAVTVAGGATLDLNGVDQTIGSLTGASGSAVALGDATLTTGGAGSTEFAGGISGSGALVKQGAETTFTLSGASTYEGPTAVDAGTLNIRHASALGATGAGSGTLVASGAALEVQGGIAVGAEPLSLAGTGVGGTGALRNVSGSNWWAGPVTLTAATKIQSDAGTLTLDVASGNAIAGAFDLTFDGAGNTTVADPIATGTGALSKLGSGTLALNGANTYTGATSVAAGTMAVSGSLTSNVTASGTGTFEYGADNVLADGNTLAVTAPDATIDIKTFDDTVGGVHVTAGSLTGSSGTLTLNTGNYVVQSGSVGANLAGSAGLSKSSGGIVTVSGQNTYGGATAIQGGTLRLDGGEDRLPVGTTVTLGSLANVGILDLNDQSQELAGLTTVGAGANRVVNRAGDGTVPVLTLNIASGTNEFEGTLGGEEANRFAVTKTGEGALVLDSEHTFSGGMTLGAGTLEIGHNDALGTGTFILNGGTIQSRTARTLPNAVLIDGDFSAGAASATGSIHFNGDIGLAEGIRTVNIAHSNMILFFNGLVSDGGLVKRGPGRLSLANGGNTFSRGVTLDAGRLTVNASSTPASGTPTSGPVGTGTLVIRGGEIAALNTTRTLANPVMVSGDFRIGGTQSLVLNGDMDLDGGSRAVAIGSGTHPATFGGQVSNGGLTKAATGELRLTGSSPNTYTGPTTVHGGTLALGKLAGLNAVGRNVVIGDGNGTATLRLDASDQIPDSATVRISTGGVWDLNANSETIAQLAGTGAVTSGAAGTATLTVGSGDAASSYDGVIEDGDGSVALTKTGGGTFILAGSNTYTAATMVLGGTLLVDGSTDSGSAVSVADSATLGGRGEVGGTVDVADRGTVAPGGSAGILRTGSATFVSGASLDIEINGTTVGDHYDQLDVAGAVVLGGATLDVSLDFTPATGDAFVIVNNDGTDPVTGTFDNLPEGNVFTVGPATFQITYQGGTGNDVVLTTIDPAAPVIHGTPGDDHFEVRRDGDVVLIYLNGNLIDSRGIDTITGPLTILAGDGNDTLTVDFSGGDPVPSEGVTYHGGDQSGPPGDALIITGNASPFANQVFTFTGKDSQGVGTGFDGHVELDGSVITFTGLEPISGGTSENTTFNLPDDINDATLQDHTIAGWIEIAGSTFEDTAVPNPSVSLTINGGDQDDTISIASVDDAFDASLIIHGGTGDDTVSWDASTTFAADRHLEVDEVDTIHVGAGAELVFSGTGSASLLAGRSIVMNAGSLIETVDGGITLEANQQDAPSSGNFVGVHLDGATVTSANGDIGIRGRGGDATGEVESNFGVDITEGSTVSSTGTGEDAAGISITGFGGEGAVFNVGVAVFGASTVSSIDGDITITGTGGDGQGGDWGDGSNYGVAIDEESVIQSTGTGEYAAAIAIEGTGGNAADGDNGGVGIWSSTVSSVDGDIGIEGQAGSSQGGNWDGWNTGVVLQDVVIQSTGTAPYAAAITIVGTGGDGEEGYNSGVSLWSSTVSSEAGDIGIEGWGGDGDDGYNNGVFIRSSTTVANIDGNIEITGQAGSGDHGYGVRIEDATVASTGSGQPTFVGDRIRIDETNASIDAGSNTVTLRPLSSGREINLGGADSATELGLTDGELDRITASTLQIGDSNSGNVTVSQPITRDAATALNVTAGGSIAFTGAGSLDSAGGNVTLTTSGTGAITSGTATPDIDAGAGTITLGAGSGGIGADGNPLAVSSSNPSALNSSTTGDADQFLAATDSIGLAGLSAGSGTVTLAVGTFTLSGPDCIQATSNVDVTGGATLAIQGFDNTVAGATLTDGHITGTGGTLTSTSTFDVRNGSVSAKLAGGVGLTKTTAGTVTLSGENTYNGATAVTGGTLTVDGSITSDATLSNGGTVLNGSGTIAGTVTVNSGATLAGSLEISGAVTVNAGGYLTPGTSPGQMSTGDLVLAPGSNVTFDVDPPYTEPGSDFDQIVVTGTVTIDGANVTFVGGAAAPEPNTTVKLIDNLGSDPVDGEFTGLPQGAAVSFGDFSGVISYSGGTGNDVVLTVLDDAVAPQVTGAYVRGGDWDQGYLDMLEHEGLGSALGGFRLIDGSEQLAHSSGVSWATIDQVAIAFDLGVTVAAEALQVYGVIDGSGESILHPVTGFDYDQDRQLATWTLEEPLVPGKFVLALDASKVTSNGVPLDGEWVTSESTYPSGDGQAGGDFHFRFNYLPGDVNGSGRTDQLDWALVRMAGVQPPDGTNYRFDYNASNQIDQIDWLMIRNLGIRAISGLDEPTVPESSSGSGAELLWSEPFPGTGGALRGQSPDVRNAVPGGPVEPAPGNSREPVAKERRLQPAVTPERSSVHDLIFTRIGSRDELEEVEERLEHAVSLLSDTGTLLEL